MKIKNVCPVSLFSLFFFLFLVCCVCVSHHRCIFNKKNYKIKTSLNYLREQLLTYKNKLGLLK